MAAKTTRLSFRIRLLNSGDSSPGLFRLRRFYEERFSSTALFTGSLPAVVRPTFRMDWDYRFNDHHFFLVGVGFGPWTRSLSRTGIREQHVVPTAIPDF